MSKILAKALKGHYSITDKLRQLIIDAHKLCAVKVIGVIEEAIRCMNNCECVEPDCEAKYFNLIRTNICPFHENKETDLYNIIVLEIVKFDTFYNEESIYNEKTHDINLYTIKFAVCKECMKTFYVVESNFIHPIFIMSNINFIDAVIYYKKLQSEFKLCHDVTPEQYESAKQIDDFNGFDYKLIKLHKLFK